MSTQFRPTIGYDHRRTPHVSGPLKRVRARLSSAYRHPLQAAHLLALLGVLGCASQPEVTKPERVVLDFAQSIAIGDYDTAYGLMSEDYRAKIGPEKFRKQLQENDREAAHIADALTRPSTEKRTETSLHFRDLDHPVVLVHGEHGARLDGEFLAFYDQSTPRRALSAFLQAADNQRYDAMLRLLPTSAKTGLGAESLRSALTGENREAFALLLTQLRQALSQQAPIEIVGNHATMTYGQHSRVQFLREGDQWKLESLE